MNSVYANSDATAANQAEILAEVEFTEHHIHNVERWFGLHSSIVLGVNEGECGSVTPFESSDCGDSDWGEWIPLLGTGDTPCIDGMTKYDFHRMIISDVDAEANKKPHIIQIARGATGAAGLEAGDYTTFICLPEKDGKAFPVDVLSPRIDVGVAVWLRHLVVGQDADAFSFYCGIHEYEV